jgi:uroporphyrinogen-III synthase
MEAKIRILSTRPLGPEILEEAARQGVSISIIPFIDTVPIQSLEVLEEIKQALLMRTAVVFTSMNAVEVVGSTMEEMEITPPDWQIYCIGNTTRALVIKYFGEDSIAGTGDNAAELAENIIEEGFVEEVCFFSGNQRRNELPDLLEAADILVNEITVYETIILPQKVEEEFAGVLFYSPSAAESFFIKNKLPGNALAFAIGKTTAEAIRKYSSNKIITADEPGKESLVWKALEILQTDNTL